MIKILSGNALISNKGEESYMPVNIWYESISTQLTFSCSKSIIETLQKSVKYVQAYHKDTRTTSRRSGAFNVTCEHLSHIFLAILLLTFNKQLFTGHEDYNPENYTRHDNFLLRNSKENVFTCSK